MVLPYYDVIWFLGLHVTFVNPVSCLVCCLYLCVKCSVYLSPFTRYVAWLVYILCLCWLWWVDAGRSESSAGHGTSSADSLHGALSSIDDFPNADSLLRDIEPSTHGFGNFLFHLFVVWLSYFIFVVLCFIAFLECVNNILSVFKIFTTVYIFFIICRHNRHNFMLPLFPYL